LFVKAYCAKTPTKERALSGGVDDVTEIFRKFKAQIPRCVFNVTPHKRYFTIGLNALGERLSFDDAAV